MEHPPDGTESILAAIDEAVERAVSRHLAELRTALRLLVAQELAARTPALTREVIAELGTQLCQRAGTRSQR